MSIKLFKDEIYKEQDCEYAVKKGGLYVREHHDGFSLVENIDEATKFFSYGLEVKKLAKYVDGTIVELFTEKSIKVIYEYEDEDEERND